MEVPTCKHGADVNQNSHLSEVGNAEVPDHGRSGSAQRVSEIYTDAIVMKKSLYARTLPTRSCLVGVVYAFAHIDLIRLHNTLILVPTAVCTLSVLNCDSTANMFCLMGVSTFEGAFCEAARRQL